mmetsp:Transcript_42433/g.92550  ORF Transcript_42433/g.92550 Transcript_42433/m.92550 type:complete len:284 (+) Transcript_42433:1682-2533(+)
MNPIDVCALGNAIDPLHGILRPPLDFEFLMAHTTIRGPGQWPPHNHSARVGKPRGVALGHGDLHRDWHLSLMDRNSARSASEHLLKLPGSNDGIPRSDSEHVVQVPTQVSNLHAHWIQFVYVRSRRHPLPAYQGGGLSRAELLPTLEDLLHKDRILDLLQTSVSNQGGPREHNVRSARLHDNCVRIREKRPGGGDLHPARLGRLRPPRPSQPVRQSHGDLIGIPDDQVLTMGQRDRPLKVTRCGLTTHGRSLRPSSPRHSLGLGRVAEPDLQIGHVLVGKTVG